MTVVWVSAAASVIVLCFAVFPAILRVEGQSDKARVRACRQSYGLKGFTIVMLCSNGLVLGFWGNGFRRLAA